MSDIQPITYTPEQLRHQIRIPSGTCPIKFQHFWHLTNANCCPPDTIICSWFWAVREFGLRRGEFYTAECIAYWVRSEFDIFDPIHDYIVQVIYEYAREIQDYLAPPE